MGSRAKYEQRVMLETPLEMFQGILDSIEKFKKELSSYQVQGTIGGIFLMLGSHGADYDYFETSDELQMDLYSEVIDSFNGKNFIGFECVPKVFLINICRC